MPKKRSAGVAQGSSLDYREKAGRIVGWLDEKQGKEITAIDVAGVCTVADAMIVVTAQSRRHAQTLADHVLAKAGDERFDYLGMEGYANALWVLLDLNDVIVHVFQEDERALYDIEGLWSEGKVIAVSGQETPS
jgi:ribosome-associated protein